MSFAAGRSLRYCLYIASTQGSHVWPWRFAASMIRSACSSQDLHVLGVILGHPAIAIVAECVVIPHFFRMHDPNR